METFDSVRNDDILAASGIFFNFLKGKYSLLETGRVLARPGRDASIRMKRKLKKFKALLEAGKMSFEDIRSAYQSWRGAYKKRFHAYKKASKIDAYYDRLFI